MPVRSLSVHSVHSSVHPEHIPDLMVLAWKDGYGHAGLDLKDPVVDLHLARASLEVEGCCVGVHKEEEKGSVSNRSSLS